MRCHQLEQELRLAFDRKVQQDRQYDNEQVLIDKRNTSLERQIEHEKESLETCRRQLRAHDSLCAGLETLMAESRKICEDSLGCVDELTHMLSSQRQEHTQLLHRSKIVSGIQLSIWARRAHAAARRLALSSLAPLELPLL